MKKQSFYTLATALCCFLFGCSENEDDIITGSFYSKTYVTAYVHAQNVAPALDDEDGIDFYVGGKQFDEGNEFRELCKRNKDTKFNNYHVSGPRIAFADSLKSIKVQSIDGFNKQHPIGSDVSDLIECTFYSFDDFVDNGYKDTGAYITRGEGSRINTVKLDETNFTDYRLISILFTLKFTQQPEVVGKHKFKIIVTTASKTIENTFEYDFENNSIF